MLDHPHVHRLTQDGRDIIIVGTAHVSRDSAELVEKVIDEEKPDVVCVELCQARFDALKQKDKWQQTDIVKVIRENRTALLLAQLMMVSFQRKIAEKFNVNPGEEMLRAIAKAEATGAGIVLADREIRITLMRTWRMMRCWTKMKFLTEMIFSLLVSEEITEEDIEKLKEHDVLDLALRTVGEKLPEVKTTLIDERDQYLAHRIGHAEGKKIVAVVGAGHVPGILRQIGQEVDLEAISRIPPAGVWGKIFGWGFPGAIIALFGAGFFYSGSQTGVNMLLSWSAITAACASVGTILMLAHPFTILAAALSAPIATLHPLIATGWVAGLVEASLRTPQVKDFLDLKDDIVTFRGFFRNKITRLLILVAFVNLTTSVGTFVAIPVMMKYIF
ncbi:MAG: TraB family protein [Syntrophus sp. (in: bacteria)]|nr:TraB family protein [Syntrophus sp. (in: bacteria)]